MNSLIAFVAAHSTVISLGLAWNFSAAMNAMPPLSENAPYFVRWFHDYAQIVAANLNKRTTANPTLPALPATPKP